MTSSTIECPIQVKAQGSKIAGRRRGPLVLPVGRVPRIARLLALAHKLDGLVSQGVVAGYAALAGLGHVSRARLSQIMSLLNLAPEFQEVICSCRQRCAAATWSTCVIYCRLPRSWTG